MNTRRSKSLGYAGGGSGIGGKHGKALLIVENGERATVVNDRAFRFQYGTKIPKLHSSDSLRVKQQLDDLVSRLSAADRHRWLAWWNRFRFGLFEQARKEDESQAAPGRVTPT